MGGYPLTRPTSTTISLRTCGLTKRPRPLSTHKRPPLGINPLPLMNSHQLSRLRPPRWLRPLRQLHRHPCITIQHSYRTVVTQLLLQVHTQLSRTWNQESLSSKLRCSPATTVTAAQVAVLVSQDRVPSNYGNFCLNYSPISRVNISSRGQAMDGNSK